LAGVEVSSKDNFGSLSESIPAFQDYKYAMKQGQKYYPPANGFTYEMRVYRPKNPKGGIFKLDTLTPVDAAGNPVKAAKDQHTFDFPNGPTGLVS
jgi:hypothetical protein